MNRTLFLTATLLALSGFGVGANAQEVTPSASGYLESVTVYDEGACAVVRLKGSDLIFVLGRVADAHDSVVSMTTTALLNDIAIEIGHASEAGGCPELPNSEVAQEQRQRIRLIHSATLRAP